MKKMKKMKKMNEEILNDDINYKHLLITSNESITRSTRRIKKEKMKLWRK